jgi:hypothetical protein
MIFLSPETPTSKICILHFHHFCCKKIISLVDWFYYVRDKNQPYIEFQLFLVILTMTSWILNKVRNVLDYECQHFFYKEKGEFFSDAFFISFQIHASSFSSSTWYHLYAIPSSVLSNVRGQIIFHGIQSSSTLFHNIISGFRLRIPVWKFLSNLLFWTSSLQISPQS